MNAPARFTTVRFFVLAALALLALLFFIPLVWMILSSFKTNSAIFSTPFSLPTTIDFTQWAIAWDVGNISRYALNSVIVTTVSVLAILGLSSAAAFAFSRYRFRGAGSCSDCSHSASSSRCSRTSSRRARCSPASS